MDPISEHETMKGPWRPHWCWKEEGSMDALYLIAWNLALGAMATLVLGVMWLSGGL